MPKKNTTIVDGVEVPDLLPDQLQLPEKAKAKRRQSYYQRKGPSGKLVTVPYTVPSVNPKDGLPAIAGHLNDLTVLVDTLHNRLKEVIQYQLGDSRKVPVPPEMIFEMAKIGVTKSDVARILGTDINFLHERKDLNEAYELGKAEQRMKLRFKQAQIAMDDDHNDQSKMLIWLGKQELGQRETPAVQINQQFNSEGGVSEFRHKLTQDLIADISDGEIEAGDDSVS